MADFNPGQCLPASFSFTFEVFDILGDPGSGGHSLHQLIMFRTTPSRKEPYLLTRSPVSNAAFSC
jgi:hypothetical protein